MPSRGSSSRRVWLSPLTALTFAVIGLTGVLMFFDLRLPGTTQLHELAGLLFVVLGGFHLQMNWRAFMSYCARRPARVALCVGGALMAGLLILGVAHEDHHRKHRMGPCSAQAARQCLE